MRTVLLLITTITIYHASLAQLTNRSTLFPHTTQPPPFLSSSIAIIGAGFSGLSAANRLIELGYNDITIFEGSDRIGGRVFPTPFENGYIQLGAEFINGKSNPIYKMASSLGVVRVGVHALIDQQVEYNHLQELVDDIELFESATFMTGECKLSPADIETFHLFADPLDPKYRKWAKSGDPQYRNQSIAQLYQQDYAQFIKGQKSEKKRRIFNALSRFYQSYFEGEWAADWNDLSIRNLVHWNDYNTRSDSYTQNEIGYKAVLDNIVSKLPSDMIRLNSRVVYVDYSNNDGIRLTLSETNGTVDKRFDYVIVTSALGHLKKYARQMFNPPLPRYKLQAIDTIGFGNLAKIFYVYDKPFWDPNVTVIVTLPTLDSDDNRPPPPLHEHFHTFVPLAWNSSVLMNWQSGEGPPVIDQLDDEVTVLLIAVQQHLPMQELSTTVTDVLRHTFNNTSIPKPVRIIRQRWTQNALFGGSYSYISVAAAKANVYYDRMANPVRIDGQLRLLFAGEATHNRIYQTTIGAWLSGRREADRIFTEDNKHRQTSTFTLASAQ